MSAGGRAFWKMTGSGNDFVFLDARGSGGLDPLESAEQIAAICRPHIGIGADGVVFVDTSEQAEFAIRYYNADGTRATLCGNASLCAAQSAIRLGLASREQTFHFMSDAGKIQGTVDSSGAATIRLAPVTHVEATAAESVLPGEQRIGYAVVGVPHLVVLVDDLALAPVTVRGRALRNGSLRAPAGANVNFVAAEGGTLGPWAMRTYERGVEAETYACGTGAVATAALLKAWGQVTAGDGTVSLKTASDRVLRVRLPDAVAGDWSELSGEGRLVYEGIIRDIE